MSKIYLFNPENDMALAYGLPRFVVRKSVRRMKSDLSILPAWYSASGASVLVGDDFDEALWRRQCLLAPDVTVVRSIPQETSRVIPWGWNHSLCDELRRSGVSPEAYPAMHEMDNIRLLSSRHTAVSTLSAVRNEISAGLAGNSIVVDEMSTLELLVADPSPLVLKEPWSGSGRGIHLVEGSLPPEEKSWAARVFLTQGSIVAEPYYKRVSDFAMEYISSGGQAKFAGYSMFETDDKGVYKRNLLISDDEIENRLSAMVGRASLHLVREAVGRQIADRITPSYEGPLGVDMMIISDGSELKLHPCVEINLRMNMGLLARRIYDHYLSSPGCFYIEYYGRSGSALSHHEEMLQKYPPVISGGRLSSGYMPLTPVTVKTGCVVYVVAA